jgi:glycosyltransferase involved in cell wall biosynthesis
MRLGFDAWGLSGDARYTGMGKYAATLIESLPRMAPEIEVFAYGGTGERRPDWLPASMTWRPTSGSVHPKLAAIDSRLREVPRMARADRLDVFHAPAVHVRPSLPPVPRLHCPVVATVHDVLPITHYGSKLPRRMRAFYRWNLRRAISSDEVVTVSEHSRAEITSATGLAPDKVTVILNGVNFPPNHDVTALERMGVSRPYILFAGSYEPRKNLGRALECYREVIRIGCPHELVAVVERESGHAAKAHSLRTWLGLDGRVRFLDSVAEADLRALYTHADVVLFPTLAEGFGLPAVQAVSCGVPVVASDLPVLREVIGDAAEFVDPGDPGAMAAAVIGLINNPDRRGELVAKGSERALQFSVDYCVHRHLDVYRRLATPQRRLAAV